MQNTYFEGWLVASDVPMTRAAYAATVMPVYSSHVLQNFVQLRGQDLVYSRVVMDLFKRLGIDYLREAEVFHYSRLESKLHLYGGFFHFIGKILTGGDSRVSTGDNSWDIELKPVDTNFSVGFTAHTQLVPEGFSGPPLVQLEFEVKLPWVLGAPEPG